LIVFHDQTLGIDDQDPAGRVGEVDTGLHHPLVEAKNPPVDLLEEGDLCVDSDSLPGCLDRVVLVVSSDLEGLGSLAGRPMGDRRGCLGCPQERLGTQLLGEREPGLVPDQHPDPDSQVDRGVGSVDLSVLKPEIASGLVLEEEVGEFASLRQRGLHRLADQSLVDPELIAEVGRVQIGCGCALQRRRGGECLTRLRQERRDHKHAQAPGRPL